MRIVEIIGAPGAGKSTLTRALRQHSANIQIGIPPSTHAGKDLPFFLWNAIPLGPVLIAFLRNKNKRRLTPQKAAMMAILQGWPRRLMVFSEATGRPIILDQGPLYMLSELRLRYGPADFSKITSKWWGRVCHDWANVLDMIVWLDSCNAVLLERIRARETRHQIKEQPDRCAMEFLDQSRGALSEVLNEMTRIREEVKVIHIDTSQVSSYEMVQNISGLLS